MPSFHSRPLHESLEEYGRGIAGGLLFSLPLLYTMEVWWSGFLIESSRLLAGLFLTYGLLLAYNRFAGMRPGTWAADILIDSVEELGLGIVLSALVLFVLGRITFETPSHEVLGKIVVETMVVAIGASVGTAQLGAKQAKEEEEDSPSGEAESREKEDAETQSPFHGQLLLGFCGAVLFAANIAPTEEVVLIAAEASPGRLLALTGLSLLIGAIILYYSGFIGAQPLIRGNDWSEMVMEITASYVIALIASAILLWFFGRFDGESFTTMLGQTVVLGFVAMLGASAGRVLIQ